MLMYKHFGLTAVQVRYMESFGFICKFVSLGCVDKDFYDVYYKGQSNE